MEGRGEKFLSSSTLDQNEALHIKSTVAETTSKNDGTYNCESTCEVKLKKPELPNSSFDESPFMEFKRMKVKRRNVQSKLTYLKQTALKKKREVSECVPDGSNSAAIEQPSGSKHSISENNDTNSFGYNQSKETKFVCPLCWKCFEKKDNYTSHLKACAVKHNLTLNQLMDAVDLQTKQTEERKALGLPGMPEKNIWKKNTTRKSTNTKDGEDPDLQLGLALSVSMSEAEEQKLLQEQNAMMEAGLGSDIIATQASLLERFGFTSSRPVLPPQPKSRQGKLKPKGTTPLLLLRTQEDRERRITEKVAIILMGDDDRLPMTELQCMQLIPYLRSQVLRELQDKDCTLWRMASALPSDNGDDYDTHFYYVKTLSNFISPSEVQAGAKLKHVSQVPGRLKTPVRNNPLEHDVPCELAGRALNHCETPASSSQHSSKTSASSSSTRCLQMNGFVKDLTCNWKRLLHDSKRSDIIVFVKDGHRINAHELVLFARCPEILNDVKETSNSAGSLVKTLEWNNVPYKSAYAFLEFLYCGSVHKIMKLGEGFDSVVMLADRYRLVDLHAHLSLVKNIRERRERLSFTYKENPEINKLSIPKSPDDDDDDTNSQSILPASSPRTESRKSEIRRRGNCCLENNSTENGNHINISNNRMKVEDEKSVVICSSPDPFSESNSENASAQDDLDCLIDLLDDAPRSHTVSGGSSEKSNLKNLSVECKLSPQNCKLQHTSSIEKRKYTKDVNSDEDIKSKRICAEDRHSVKVSLLEKFIEMSPLNKENDMLKVDLTQSSERTCPPLTKDTEAIETMGSPVYRNEMSLLNSSSQQKYVDMTDDTNNLCVNKDKGESQDANDILGDMCADFEYNQFCSNYSPYKSPLLSSQQKVHFEAETETSCRSIKRSLSQNYMEDEMCLGQENQRSRVCLSSSASSPVSVKCLSQDSIHLKNIKKEESLDEIEDDLPEVPLSQVFVNSVSQGQKTRSPHSSQSLNTIRHLLEDTFVKDLGSTTFWKETDGLLCNSQNVACSTPKALEVRKASSAETPQDQMQRIKSNDVTPLADYSAMETPVLKRELQKYGLKPLKRKQAKLILRHIYNELHPWVPINNECVTSSSLQNDPVLSPVRKNASKAPASQRKPEAMSTALGDASSEQNDSSVSSSLESVSSCGRSDIIATEECPDEAGTNERNTPDIGVAIHDYIRSDEALHKKVLLYEPIWLEELHSALKAKNYTFKLQQIIEYLDEQCITFRTLQKSLTKKRTRKKKS